MRVSSAVVRKLRIEHGWSQDQLATVAGLSLRTVQRVEAEGTASLETRTSLAAALGVPLAQLAEEPVSRVQACEATARLSLARYKVAAVAAAIAFICMAITLLRTLHASFAWIGTVATMIVIALVIYAALGWYMTGAQIKQSRRRRMAQAFFIFGAIFCALALGSREGAATLAFPALAGVVAIGIYFAVGFVISRRGHSARTPQ